MSNNLPENDGELIEDVYENQDSNDQFDISAIGEAYANQKTYPSINPYTGQPDTSGITPVNDNTVANQNAVIDTADRTPQQYTVDTSQNAGTPGSPIVNPTIVEEAPLPRTRIVTYTSYYDMEITDYSPSALASLQSQGYKAIAVYDDGTEAEISWSEVRDLNPIAEYILTDIEEMTLANNQHFWTRSENPDGAGSGAFVTDDTQDAFIHSAQNNFADQGDASETVEQTETFTSDGLTTQYDLYYEAASTDYSVKVNGYNVNSGITKNTTNFVFDDAPDIDATVSVTYETQAKPWNNLLLNSYGLALRQGLTNLATFTKSAVTFFDGEGNQNSNINAFFGRDGSRIGKETESHIQLDYHSLQLIDFEGNRYLHVSDLRDHDGLGPVVTETCEGTYEDRYSMVQYTLSYNVATVYGQPQISSVTYNGTPINYTYYPPNSRITNTMLYAFEPTLWISYDSVNASGYPYRIEVTYTSTGEMLKAFTFGNRVANNFIAPFSASFGVDNIASGKTSHAEGTSTTASGHYAHAEGWLTIASGNASHAEGDQTTASGHYSHAEGCHTTTTAFGHYAHAEGIGTTASGNASHAEGTSTASGHYAHAEGSKTTASGDSSHTEGYYTTASGRESHAEGYYTTASGQSSHASGYYTKATAENQFVIGKYNAVDANALFIVGNGSSDSSRSNVFKVNFSGQTHAIGGGIKSWCTYIDRNGSLPSSDQYTSDLGSHGGTFECLDKDGDRLSYYRTIRRTNGQIGWQLVAWNRKADDSATVYGGGISGFVARDGTTTYSVSDAAAFRSAIGALSTSGGTLSGDLVFDSGSDDSPDIVFRYANDREKSRIWTDNTYSSAIGPNYRVYKSDGTSLYSGRLATIAEAANASFLSSGTVPMARNYTYSATLSRNTTYTTQGTITVHCTGKTAYVRIDNLKKTNSSRTTVATLPAGYRPPIQWYGWIAHYNGTGNSSCNFIIETNGEIKTEGNMGPVWGCVAFPAWQ